MAHDRSPHKEKKKAKKHHEEKHGPTLHQAEIGLLHPRVPSAAESAPSKPDAKKGKYEPHA